MPRPCPYCSRGPDGVEGHEGLYIVDIKGGPDYRAGMPIFRCSACGAAWARQYVGGGSFQWIPKHVTGGFSSDGH
jgi:hypothetical protein